MKRLSPFDRLLALFFFFIGLMVAFRIFYTGSIMHLFLCWNIFLAWIPYVLSNFFVEIKTKARWKQLLLFITWLLFFPNALYIVTDLIHIEDNTDIPVWYDAVLLFAASFIGIIMAFVSLRKVEYFLARSFSKLVVSILIPVILFTASFGVYLGRFQRWNSWDVLKDPLALGIDILNNFLYPVHNYRTWAITILFTGIYSLLYFFLKILPHAFADHGKWIKK
jgi:uncharacterized membrane protein